MRRDREEDQPLTKEDLQHLADEWVDGPEPHFTFSLTKDSVLRCVKAIAMTTLEAGWEYGKEPFTCDNPPPSVSIRTMFILSELYLAYPNHLHLSEIPDTSFGFAARHSALSHTGREVAAEQMGRGADRGGPGGFLPRGSPPEAPRRSPG